MSNWEKIKERAYALWEQQGRPLGLHEEHWAQAQQELGEGEGREPDPGLPEQFEADDGDHGIPRS